MVWVGKRAFYQDLCSYFVVIRCVRQNCLWIVHSYCLAYANRIFYSTILYHRYSRKRWRKVLSVSCSQPSQPRFRLCNEWEYYVGGKFDDNIEDDEADAGIVNQIFLEVGCATGLLKIIKDSFTSSFFRWRRDDKNIYWIFVIWLQ